MKKFIIIDTIILFLLIAVTLNIHVVQLDHGFKFLKKTQMSFEDTYVDARGFANKIKLLSRPALIEAGIKDIFDDNK